MKYISHQLQSAVDIKVMRHKHRTICRSPQAVEITYCIFTTVTFDCSPHTWQPDFSLLPTWNSTMFILSFSDVAVIIFYYCFLLVLHLHTRVLFAPKQLKQSPSHTDFYWIGRSSTSFGVSLGCTPCCHSLKLYWSICWHSTGLSSGCETQFILQPK